MSTSTLVSALYARYKHRQQAFSRILQCTHCHHSIESYLPAMLASEPHGHMLRMWRCVETHQSYVQSTSVCYCRPCRLATWFLLRGPASLNRTSVAHRPFDAHPDAANLETCSSQHSFRLFFLHAGAGTARASVTQVYATAGQK